MKKTLIAIALLVAAIATAGQLRHPANSLTVDGQKLMTGEFDWPFPACPPSCAQAR